MRTLLLLLLAGLFVLPVYSSPSQNLKLFNYSSYISQGGEAVVTGEVINDSPDPVTAVEVKADFKSPEGKILHSASTLVAIDLIPPGQRAPFIIVGEPQYSTNVESFDLEIVNFADGQDKQSKLEITATNGYNDGREAAIIGTIHNNADTTAQATNVYATFYDDGNKVTGFAAVESNPPAIAPNAEAEFKITANNRVPLIESYTLYAQSENFSSIPFGLQSISNPLNGRGKVDVSKLTLVDQEGDGIGKVAPNDRGWIKSILVNNLPLEQEFSYIVLIKDHDGLPVELKWVEGSLEPNMSISPSISWTPVQEGLYFAQIYVWQSMENPVPLSMSIKTIILLVQA